jgi:acetylornithine deacetylase/succinyl-diaminopimelate desuccinylase-like protein
MKDGDAAMVESLIRLKRERLCARSGTSLSPSPPTKRPAATRMDRRSCSRSIADLIDADMAINLDGGGGDLKNGRPLYFEVGTSEKTYVTFTLETTSPGGHGSLPGPDNAIYRLADGLGRLEAFKFPVMLTATTRASFDKLAALRAGTGERRYARRGRDTA